MVLKPQRRTQVERRDESERRMLEAGVRMVAERGLEKLSLGDVGIAAGYSRGLPAHHFGAKSDYLKALAEFIAAEYRAEVLAAPGNWGLTGLVEFFMRGCRLSPDDTLRLCISYVMHSEVVLSIDSDLGHLKKGALHDLRLHLEQGIKKGEIRKDVHSRRLSDVLLVAILGLQAEWLRDQSYDLEAATTELLSVIIPGLAASPEAVDSAMTTLGNWKRKKGKRAKTAA